MNENYNAFKSYFINEEEFNDVEFKEFDMKLIYESVFEYGSSDDARLYCVLFMEYEQTFLRV